MINESKIKEIGELSKIYLEDKDIEKFKKELTKIIDILNKLSNFDTKGIEPLFNTSISTNSIREDFAKKSEKGILELSSYFEENVLVIPKVL